MTATALKKPDTNQAQSDGEPVTHVILAERNGLISGDSAQALRVGGSLNLNGPGGGRILAMFQEETRIRVLFQGALGTCTAFVPNENVSVSANFPTAPAGPVAA